MNSMTDPLKVAAIREALKDHSKSQQRQIKAEIKELPSVLGEKELPEKLLLASSGVGAGLLVDTNQRLLFIDKRPFSSVRVEHIPYNDITSIESKTTSIFGGEILIGVMGDVKQFTNIPKALTEPFAQHLRTKAPFENLDTEEPETRPPPSPEVTEAIRRAGAKLRSSSQGYVRKELDELPSILGTDELPERMIEGFYDGGTGLLVATDQRLIFLDKRRFTGLRVEYFVYDNITAIQSKTGIVWGSIRIHSGGIIEEITHVNKDSVHPFAEYLRKKVSAKKSAAAVAAPPTPAVSSLADELKKLADLVEMGILTKEEFEQQKAKLLGT